MFAKRLFARSIMERIITNISTGQKCYAIYNIICPLSKSSLCLPRMHKYTYHTILHSVVFLCKMLNSVSEGKTAGSWQEYQQLSWALNLLMPPKQLLFLQHCWKLVSIVGENIIPIFVKFYLKDNFVNILVERCRDFWMTKLVVSTDTMASLFYWYNSRILKNGQFIN